MNFSPSKKKKVFKRSQLQLFSCRKVLTTYHDILLDCLLGFPGPSSSQKLSVGTKEIEADSSLVHTNDMILLSSLIFLCF